MKLRSGRTTGPYLIIYDFPVDSIVRCANSPWLLDRVKEVTFILRHSTFDSDPRTYRKCVAIICSVIECTHKYKTEDLSPETKRAFIRLLSAAYKVQVDVGEILWANRRDIDMDDDHYRCLKHIISDESLPYNYDIHTYDDGEYTDIELWDYYFYFRTVPDPYVQNAEICFGGEIYHWNPTIIA
jgi:hypothetical protein